jgi:hypothetical protein
LTITAVNDSPTITSIVNQTIQEDTTIGPISFTVADIEGVPSLITASSNNLTLVTEENISIGGSGPSRSVTITPTADESGSVTITITADDGIAQKSTTFIMTITGVNDAPTLTMIENDCDAPR